MESRNWIGGEWITPEGEEIVVKNPSDLEEEIGIVHRSPPSAALEAVRAARHAASSWAGITGSERGQYLFRLADILRENLDEVATLASNEMGKPITEMRGEVTRGIQLFRYYASKGVGKNGDVIPSNTGNVLQYTKRVPLGVVGIITPWNFPVAIPIWKIAPALICGNTVVWKPAEIASLTATRIAQLFEQAGMPDGVVNLVIGRGSSIGDALVKEADLNAVSFTGSSATGQEVATACAKRNIKFQTEKGGKNAAIVLNDANLEKTVPALFSGAFRSSGQKCTATSRIIVEKGITERLAKTIREKIAEVRLGSALDPNSYLGPIASKDQFDKVISYVRKAENEAEPVAKGTPFHYKKGYYVEPIIATGISDDHPLAQEEIFGPVAVLLPVENYQEAMKVCNDSEYGLSASLFTQDLAKAHRFLDDAQAGMVRVNQETAGVEYQAPFGGMKQSSSHTREQGEAALDFYSELKTCAINYGF